MAITNSPLRYPGGKSSLSPFIAEVINLNCPAGGVSYAEPFAGGAGAALNLLFDKTVDRIYINDADPLIYKFWLSILDAKEEFLERIENTKPSIDEWHKCKKIVSKHDINSILDVGFSVFFLNRCNHSGILRSNPIGGINQTGKWKIDARFNKDTLIKKIKKIINHSESIILSNLDAIDFLHNIKNEENIFSFIDPPYYEKGSNLYLSYYTEKNHKHLSEELKQCDFKWIMTYDNISNILDLYTWCSIREFSLNYFAHRPKKGSEILIHSHTLKTPMDLKPQYGLARSHRDTLKQGALL